MAEEKVTAGGDPLVRGGPLARGGCPHCGKAIHWKDNRYRPFCSDRRWPFGQRCKLIDLGNRRWPFGQWIEGEYCIDGENPRYGEKEEGRGGTG